MIPTTEVQGAFSVSIRDVGACTNDRDLLESTINFGRIGALNSHPLQIKCKELGGLLSLPLECSAIGKWLRNEFSGFNFQRVNCIDEDHFVEEYLQFRVPSLGSDSFPKNGAIGDKSFRINHVLAYANPISSGMRPPIEQTVHEHWKTSVNQTVTQRKGHFNTIEKTENSPGSMQRFLKLRQISVGQKHTETCAYFEHGLVPLCFFTREVSMQSAVDKFIHVCKSTRSFDSTLLATIETHLADLAAKNDIDTEYRLCVATVNCEDKQSLKLGRFVKGKYGWTVSTSERLQCYAYTPCTLLFIVPPGCRVNEVCSPISNIHICNIFPMCNEQEDTSPPSGHYCDETSRHQPTPLGVNGSRSPVSHSAILGGEDKIDPSTPDPKVVASVSPTLSWPRKAHTTGDPDEPFIPHVKAGEVVSTTTGKFDARIGTPDRPSKSRIGDCNLESQLPTTSIKHLDKKDSQHSTARPENPLSPPDVSAARVTNIAEQHPGGSDVGQVERKGYSGTALASFDDALGRDGCSHGKDLLSGLKDLSPPCTDEVFHETPKMQEVVPPKPRTARFRGGINDSRSTSSKRSGNKALSNVSCLNRSVSPTIGKTQKSVGVSKLQDCLHAQTGRKKGLHIDKPIPQPPQVDVGKPIGVPVPLDQDMSPREATTDTTNLQVIDLITSENKKAAEQDAALKGNISDAIQKWRSELPHPHQQRIAHIALQIMQQNQLANGLLFSVYRLLAKAPWTSSMISIDVKQAALYAISRGWHIKCSHSQNFPFSEAEFAVAAATYLEQVPLQAQSDVTQALGVIVDFLPLVCGSMFSQATLQCPTCSAHCTAPVPSFILTSTWTMSDWSDFATAISQANLQPWIQQHGWHKEGCGMSSFDVSLNLLGPWVLLQLSATHQADLPLLRDSIHITKDSGLHLLDATVTSLLCTSSLLSKGEGKQFWVAEFEGQNIAAVYNLLEGKQKLTQTLAKNLRVVGVLLHIGKSRTPLLRSKDLDRAAGITTRVLRCEAPIKVAGRQRLQKARNALCKKLAREPLSGKKVKKHTLKACKTKAKRKVNNPRSARVSKDTTTSTGRRHKKQREGTLQWHFSRPSLPQGGLWEKPVTGQVTDGHVLEVSDDSPRCADDDLKLDENSRVELSTDPISEFSVDPEQPVVDMPPSSIGTVPILSVSIGTRTKKLSLMVPMPWMRVV